MKGTDRAGDVSRALATEPTSRWSNGIGWSVLGLLAVYGLYTCRFGLDLFDSGLYPSMGWRYTQGDRPFLDETFSSHFDLLYWLLFTLVPDAPQLHIRYLGIGLEMLAMVCWYVLLKRFASPLLIALALTTSAFSSAGGLWVPGYDVLGTRFLHISIAMWLLACVMPTRVKSDSVTVLAAGTFLIAILCHPAMIAAIFFPIGMALYGYLRCPTASWRRPTIIWATTVLGGLLLLALLLLFLGVLGREAASYQATGDLVSTTHRFKKLGYGLLLCLPGSAILFVSLYLSTSEMDYRHRGASLGFRFVGVCVLVVVGCLSAMLIPPKAWVDPVSDSYIELLGVTESLMPDWAGDRIQFLGQHWISMLSLAGLMVVIARHRSIPKEGKRPIWYFYFWAVTLTLLPAATLHALTSLSGFRAFIFAISPLFLASVVVLFRITASRLEKPVALPPTPLFVLPLALVCLTFGCIQLEDRTYRFCGETNSDSLDTTSKHPLLNGVYTTAERMKLVEGTIDYLAPRMETGDLLLEFGAGPLFYYLTRTRPALSKTWCIPAYTDARQEQLLNRMIEEERLPEFCLTSPIYLGYDNSMTWDQVREGKESPINRYIWDHYDRVHTMGPFEVWERRAPIATTPQ